MPTGKCAGVNYISTPAGVILRTTQSEISLVTTNIKADGSTDTESAKSHEVQVPPYKAIFVPWSKNISSIHFDNQVIYAPDLRENEAMIVHKPLIAKPNLTWTDILNVPDVGTEQISFELEKFNKRMSEIDAIASKFIGPGQIIDVLLNIPKWIKAAFYVLCVCCGITLIMWARKFALFVLKTFRPNKKKKTVGFTTNTPSLRKTRSIMSLSSRKGSLASIANALVTNTQDTTADYVHMYPVIQDEQPPLRLVPSVPPYPMGNVPEQIRITI